MKEARDLSGNLSQRSQVRNHDIAPIDDGQTCKCCACVCASLKTGHARRR